MNKKFAKRLTEYLDSECSDYGLSYSWEWNGNLECCEVDITRDNETKYSTTVNFRYDGNSDDILIELSEDSFYHTREYDETVKYFWMLISPRVFSES